MSKVGDDINTLMIDSVQLRGVLNDPRSTNNDILSAGLSTSVQGAQTISDAVTSYTGSSGLAGILKLGAVAANLFSLEVDGNNIYNAYFNGGDAGEQFSSVTSFLSDLTSLMASVTQMSGSSNFASLLGAGEASDFAVVGGLLLAPESLAILAAFVAGTALAQDPDIQNALSGAFAAAQNMFTAFENSLAHATDQSSQNLLHTLQAAQGSLANLQSGINGGVGDLQPLLSDYANQSANAIGALQNQVYQFLDISGTGATFPAKRWGIVAPIPVFPRISPYFLVDYLMSPQGEV